MPASLFAAWAGYASGRSGVTAVTSVTFKQAHKAAALSESADVPDSRNLQAAEATIVPIDLQVVTAVAHTQSGWLPTKSHADQSRSPRNLGNLEIGSLSAGLDAGDPGAWHSLLERQIAYRLQSADRTREEAESLAFSDCLLQWHRRHGARQQPERCAGCREPFVENDVLDLGSGARVHLDPGFSCLTRYGQAWRRAALAGLQALGLEPPAVFELL